ncbi:MAG: outer membrane protein assembly factor BamD [Methylibium sp.]|uniref:outer membrane protein assembly factor BamD n=1 Tax=Methylibium sp. TaxID=2067992 RepID=UPI0017DD1850|nr:outer membrane protein assembly factor BamD [Methylibium sp.]MBA3597590.1 outer membrane protein assembly factor BamD [Methylibium sp.]
MQRAAIGASRVALATLLGLVLAGCNTTPTDETAGMSTEKLYGEAKDEASVGNWERATMLYGRLEARAAGTPLAQQAQLDLAYAFYRSGEKAQAETTIERFIKLHPSSPALDYAYYLQGLINFNENLGLLGNLARQDLSERDQRASRDAYQSFKQLVQQFPDSKYAPDAQLRMNYIVNTLAQYEVHVARYYYRRGAYVAAANRAQQAVQEFQSAPATEEALFIMTLAYDRLSLPDLRDDARRVLTQSFPQSSYVTEGFAAADKPWWQLW